MSTITEYVVLADTEPETAYAVLARFEHNGYHDSDFFEVTWDGSNVRVVCTGTTAGAGRFFSGNPEARTEQDTAARRHIAPRLTAIMIAQEEARAAEPHPGRTVRSLTTRGKNVGVTGVVRRVEVNHFSRNENRLRLEVELDGGERRWLDAHRTEVTAGFGDVDHAQIGRRATSIADNSSWLDLVHRLGLRRGAYLA